MVYLEAFTRRSGGEAAKAEERKAKAEARWSWQQVAISNLMLEGAPNSTLQFTISAALNGGALVLCHLALLLVAIRSGKAPSSRWMRDRGGAGGGQGAAGRRALRAQQHGWRRLCGSRGFCEHGREAHQGDGRSRPGAQGRRNGASVDVLWLRPIGQLGKMPTQPGEAALGEPP